MRTFSLSYLFEPRRRGATLASRPSRIPLEAGDAAVLTLYTAILAFTIHHHRDWSDEAQAWLMARDCSLPDLVLHRLHYEGAPALWPLILWIAARLHLPYAGINWLGGCFAIAGIGLFLAWCPFPRIFRWLLPFSFFLQYQYAVFARPYVLFPLLLFVICTSFGAVKPRPVTFALAAGLLANVGLHAAILSGVFSLLYLHHVYEIRTRIRESLRSLSAAIALYAVLCGLAAIIAFPAPDVAFAVDSHGRPGLIHALQIKLIGEEHLPPTSPPLDPPLRGHRQGISAASHLSPLAERTVATIILVANAICFPIARSNLLAVAALISLALWLHARRRLRLMLPFWVGLILSVQIFVYDHHTGQFFLALVAAVWIALETSPRAPVPAWITTTFATLACAVVVLQIGWTVHCIRAEASRPFDPGLETEHFLASHFSGKRIAGFSYDSVSTQAYAAHSLFINQPDAFWHWSNRVLIDRRRTEALIQHPDAVVVGDFTYQQEFIQNQWRTLMPPGRHHWEMIEFWQQHGYRITHRFCGDRVMRLGTSSTFCEVILEKNDMP